MRYLNRARIKNSINRCLDSGRYGINRKCMYVPVCYVMLSNLMLLLDWEKLSEPQI